MAPTWIFLACVWCNFVEIQTVQQQDFTLKQNDTLSKRQFADFDLIFESNVRSRIECIRLCQPSVGCRGVTLKESTGGNNKKVICRGHSDVKDTTSQHQNDTDAIYYSMVYPVSVDNITENFGKFDIIADLRWNFTIAMIQSRSS